jgi:hypothetical protein
MNDMPPNTFLDGYATESLKTMARRRGWRDAGGAGKAALIAFLEPRLFSREANEQLIRSLPERQKQLLAALKARGCEAAIVTLTATVDGDAEEVTTDIRDLVELGLMLYPAREASGRKYRLGECPRVWMDAAAAHAVKPAATQGDRPRLLATAPEDVSQACPGLLLADLVIVLNALERKRVPPPEPGRVPGRPWRDLAGLLLLPSEPPDEDAGIAPRLAFIYALLETMGLVRVRSGRLVADPQAAGLFHGDRGELHRVIFDAWKRTHGWDEFKNIPEILPRPVPDEALGVHTPSTGRVSRARGKVLTALKRFSPGRWYAFSSLAREMKTQDPDFLIRRDGEDGQRGSTYRGFGQRGRGDTALPLDLTGDWDKVEGRFLARLLLEPLHWLGLVDLGLDLTSHGKTTQLDAFSLTPVAAFLLGATDTYPDSPHEAVPLLVQPDFTILCLSPEPDPGLLHDLAGFADYTGGDRVARFALSRESVQRGLHADMAAEDMKGILSRATGGSLPQNVTASLLEWQTSHHRFRLVQGVTLVEDPHGLVPRSSTATQVLDGLGTEIAPGLYRPLRADAASVRALLRPARIRMRHLDYAAGPARVLSFADDDVITCSPRGDDWLTRGLLESVAGPVPHEHGQWRIEPSKVRATVESGKTTREIIQALAARSAGVSARWRLKLTVWSRPTPTVAVAKAALFTCSDGQLRELILAVPELAAEIGEQIADDTFVVHPGRMTALRRSLRSFGLALRGEGSIRVATPASPSPARRGDDDSSTLPFRWSRQEAAAGAAAGTAQLRFLLLRAVQARRKVRIQVRQNGKTSLRKREMAPLALDGSSLTARCERRGGQETIPLGQIQTVELLPARYLA